MPEYLAPGVFVEETSFRARSIEGVSTSVAGIVGPTRTGPVRGLPEPVTSMNEFAQVFGGLENLELGPVGNTTSVLNYTALAAKAFFDNGGKQLYVARVMGNVNGISTAGDDSSATRAQVSAGSGGLQFRSRFPGRAGNYTLEVLWRDSENLFSIETIPEPLDGGTSVFIEATGVPDAAQGTSTLDGALFPLTVRGVVRRVGADVVLQHVLVEDTNGAPVDPAALDNSLVLAELPTATTSFRAVRLRRPASGALVTDDAVEVALAAAEDISSFTGANHWGPLTALRGRLGSSGTVPGELDQVTFDASLNAGVTGDITVPLASLIALASGAAVLVRRTFDLRVLSGGASGEEVYRASNLNTSDRGAGSLHAALLADPVSRSAQRTQPISAHVQAGANVLVDLQSLFQPGPIDTPDPLLGARYLFNLTGGTDGTDPIAGDYAGEIDPNGNIGLAAFEDIEDISIVLTPAAVTHDQQAHHAVVVEVQKHCRKMRYRIGVVDAPQNASIGEVREFRGRIGDESRLALYHPWVVISGPSAEVPTLTVPPSGFAAGVYAGTDVRRGVHKAPANEPVIGALAFSREVNRFQQELLNPDGINCLRSFPLRGHLVWGARTCSTDPEWKYVNVRRYFLFLERSIEKSMQWAVFEPNGEALWANVRGAVSDFLYNEWRGGRLLGGTPKVAYFVRCDRSTMTQNDIDNGRLVCEVGVAPLRPAEFVIFRIGQKTADA